jgi:hypothetical protein
MHRSNSSIWLSGGAPRLNLERGIGVAILLLLLVSLTAAQKKPNFSGRWEMDTAKSQLRPLTKWNHLSLAVEHQEPKLIVNMTTRYADGGESTTQLPLTTDGREVALDVTKGSRIYRTNWVGAKLVIKWDQGGERSETWTLSPDGKTLTIDCSAKPANGPEQNWKHVLNKKMN